MLSYQHLYHAGNFADLHKHTLLVQAMTDALALHPRLHYFDTHAGDGLYDLQSTAAQKTNEAASGFLANKNQKPPPWIDRLYQLQNGINEGGPSRFYGGSPALALALLRAGYKATLVDRHPSALKALRKNFRHDRRLEVVDGSGFEVVSRYNLAADWPGLVLIDPSYEQKHETDAVLGLVGTIIRRWRLAKVLVWFPLLDDARHQPMIDGLSALKLGRAVLSMLHRPPVAGESLRMVGSGMAIISRNLPNIAPITEATDQLAKWLKVTGETQLVKTGGRL